VCPRWPNRTTSAEQLRPAASGPGSLPSGCWSMLSARTSTAAVSSSSTSSMRALRRAVLSPVARLPDLNTGDGSGAKESLPFIEVRILQRSEALVCKSFRSDAL
jgi:hypothetical protein